MRSGMSGMRGRVCTLLALAGVLAAEPALADEKDKDKPAEVIAPSPGALASGRTALREGLALREKGETEAALGRLQSAWDFVPTPITGFELGKTHLMLGHVLQAFDLFAKVGRLKLSPEESSRSQIARDEAARLAKEIEPRIPTLRIKVSVPPNATVEVKVDDEKVPLTNNENKLLVEVGPHDVVAKAGDGPEQKVHVEVAESEVKDVPLTPQWVAPAPKPVTGPGGQVIYVRTTNPLTFVGFGIAAAGLVVTVVSAVIFFDARNDAEERCGKRYCPPENETFGPRTGVIDTEFNSAKARLYGAGAVMATGAVTTLVFGGIGAIFAARPIKERVTAQHPTVRPSVGVGRLGLEGSF